MAIRKKSLMMVVGLLCAGSSMQGMQYPRRADGTLFPSVKEVDGKLVPSVKDANGNWVQDTSFVQNEDGSWGQAPVAAPAIVVTPEEEQPEIEQPKIAPEPVVLPHSGSDMNLAGITGSTKHQPHVGPQSEEQEPAAQEAQPEQQGQQAPESATTSPSASRRSSVSSPTPSVKEAVEDLINGAQGAADAQPEDEADSLSVSENEAGSGSEADGEGRAGSPVKRRRGPIDQEGSASGDEDAQRGGGKLEDREPKRAKRGPSEDEAVKRFAQEGDQELSGLEDEDAQTGEAGAGTAGEQPKEQPKEEKDKENKEDLNKTENAPKCCWNKVKTPVAFCAVALVTYCGYRLHQWWKGNAASSDVSEDDSLDKNGGSEL